VPWSSPPPPRAPPAPLSLLIPSSRSLETLASPLYPPRAASKFSPLFSSSTTGAPPHGTHMAPPSPASPRRSEGTGGCASPSSSSWRNELSPGALRCRQIRRSLLHLRREKRRIPAPPPSSCSVVDMLSMLVRSRTSWTSYSPSLLPISPPHLCGRRRCPQMSVAGELLALPDDGATSPWSAPTRRARRSLPRIQGHRQTPARTLSVRGHRRSPRRARHRAPYVRARMVCHAGAT
jgi:hypothetical protein